MVRIVRDAELMQNPGWCEDPNEETTRAHVGESPKYEADQVVVHGVNGWVIL